MKHRHMLLLCCTAMTMGVHAQISFTKSYNHPLPNHTSDVPVWMTQTLDSNYVMHNSDYVYASRFGYTKIDPLGNIIWQREMNFTGIAATARPGPVVQLSDSSLMFLVNLNYTQDSPSTAAMVKTDAAGTLLFTKRIDRDLNDIYSSSFFFSDARPTDDGGFIALGSGCVAGSLIARFDGQGQLVWHKILVLTGYDGGLSYLDRTDDGNYMLFGQGLYASNIEDLWVLKMDPNGNVLLSKNIATGFNHFSGDIVRNGSNYYIMSKTYASSSLGYGYHVAMVDAQAQLVWSSWYGLPFEPIASTIATDADGGCVIVGQLMVVDTIMMTVRGNAFIHKVDVTGSTVYMHSSSQTFQTMQYYNCSLYDVRPAPGGTGMIATGMNDYDFGIMVTRTDQNGMGLCNPVPVAVNDSMLSPVVTNETTIVIQPTYYLISEDQFLGTPALSIATHCSSTTTGAEEYSAATGDLLLSPNPGDGHFQLTGLTGGTAQLRIYDMRGQVVYTQALQSTAAEIDVSSLAPGVYFCAVEEHGKPAATQRLVISR